METSSSPAIGTNTVLPPGVLPLRPGDPAEIGGHPLAGRLGAGGMGVVYLGHDPLGGLVAVKAAHRGAAGDEEVLRRFRAEVASVRQVPPACTARLLVDGTDKARPYIITEYVEGRSLEDIVEKEGPLPPEQLRALATGVARAMAAIHAAGLIHRDLKPANVLLTPTGPRVIDFGIAQEVPAAGGPTAIGMVMGSPGWIAPERLTRCPATPAADVFGWGCLVGYAGTARNPFGDGDVDAIAQRTIHEPPDLDGLEDSLRPLVAATLAKDPADRPSAGELLALLSPADPLAGSAPRGRIASTAMPVVRARPRRGRALAAACAALAVAATVAALAATGAGWEAPWAPGGGAVVPPSGAPGSHRAVAPRSRPPAPVRPAPAVTGRHAPGTGTPPAGVPGTAPPGTGTPAAGVPAMGPPGMGTPSPTPTTGAPGTGAPTTPVAEHEPGNGRTRGAPNTHGNGNSGNNGKGGKKG